MKLKDYIDMVLSCIDKEKYEATITFEIRMDTEGNVCDDGTQYLKFNCRRI